MPNYQYNEKIFTLPELRLLFPHVSLPAMPATEDLPDGVVIVPDSAPDPAAALVEAKAERLRLLAERFAHAEAFGHFGSSLGFEVDATERANRDVAGLVTLMASTAAPETYLCDYSSQMRPVSLADLKTLQLELITHGQLLYARKWELQNRIAAAESVEAVEHIEISFDDLPAPVAPVAPDVTETTGAPSATGAAEATA